MDEESVQFLSNTDPPYQLYSEEETVDELDSFSKAYLAVTIIVCVLGIPSNCMILYLIAKRKLYRDLVWLLHTAFSITLIMRIIMLPILYHAYRHPSGFVYETKGSCIAFHFFAQYASVSSNLMLLALVFMRLVSFTPLCKCILKHLNICVILVCTTVFSVTFFSAIPIVSHMKFDIDDKVPPRCHISLNEGDSIRWLTNKVVGTTFVPFILGMICTIVMLASQKSFYRMDSTPSVLCRRNVDGLVGQNIQNEIGSVNQSNEVMEDRPTIEYIFSERSQEEEKEKKVTILHNTFMVIYMVILLPNAIVHTVILYSISSNNHRSLTSELFSASWITYIVSCTVGMIYPLACFIIIPQFRRF